MRATWIGLAAGLATLIPAAAEAGFVITANLPSGSAIVGIDGTADGARTFSGGPSGQNDWFSPFNTSGKLVEYTFQPGTYTFRVINNTDAAALFPGLTSAQLNQIGPSAWTYNSPWITQYMAWDSSAATDPTVHQLFTGSVAPVSYGNAADAYAAAVAGGYYNKIVTGSGRETGTVQSSYTFASAETLIFAVPDYALSDNAGLVSVLISGQPAVIPEPSSFLLIGLGAVGLGLTRLRAKAGPIGASIS